MKVMRVAVIVVTLLGLVGVTKSQAQVTNVLGSFNASFSGKLSPSGAKVATADLTGNTNGLALLELPGNVLAIGQYVVVSGTTNVAAAYAVESALAQTGRKKSRIVFTGTSGPTSNLVWLADLSVSGSSGKIAFKTKVSGVWIDGSNAVSGAFNSIKSK